MSALGTVWEREVLGRLLDHGMRGVDPVRREIVAGVSGRVLELGIGTGASLPFYGPGVRELVAVEPAAGLAHAARARLEAWSARTGQKSELIEASATRPLPLDAHSFDGIVILFVLCSVSRLDAVLDECARLLVPGGAIHLAEHVAADGDPTQHRARATVQRIIQPAWKLALGGCDPYRSLDAALSRHGFDVGALERRELDLPWVVRSGLVGRAPLAAR